MDLKNEPLIIKFCQVPTKLQTAQKNFISELTVSARIVLCTWLYDAPPSGHILKQV